MEPRPADQTSSSATWTGAASTRSSMAASLAPGPEAAATGSVERFSSGEGYLMPREVLFYFIILFYYFIELLNRILTPKSNFQR